MKVGIFCWMENKMPLWSEPNTSRSSVSHWVRLLARSVEAKAASMNEVLVEDSKVGMEEG